MCDEELLRNTSLFKLVAINSTLYLRADLGPGDKGGHFCLLGNFGPEAHRKDIEIYLKTKVLTIEQHFFVLVVLSSEEIIVVLFLLLR